MPDRKQTSVYRRKRRRFLFYGVQKEVVQEDESSNDNAVDGNIISSQPDAGWWPKVHPHLPKVPRIRLKRW